MKTKMDEDARKTVADECEGLTREKALQIIKRNGASLKAVWDLAWSTPDEYRDINGKRNWLKIHHERVQLYPPRLRRIVRWLVRSVLGYIPENRNCWYFTKWGQFEKENGLEYFHIPYLVSIVERDFYLCQREIALCIKYNGKCFNVAKALWNKGRRREAYMQIEKHEADILGDWDAVHYDAEMAFVDELETLLSDLVKIIGNYHENIEADELAERFVEQPFQDSAPTTPPQTATTPSPTDTAPIQTPPMDREKFLHELEGAVGGDCFGNVKQLLNAASKDGWLMKDYRYNPKELRYKSWRKCFAEMFFRKLGVEFQFRWQLLEQYWGDAGYRGIKTVNGKIKKEIRLWMDKQKTTQRIGG